LNNEERLKPKKRGGLMNQLDFDANAKNLEYGKMPERHLVHIDQYPITEIRSTIEKLAEALGNKGGVMRLYFLGEHGTSFEKVFVEPFGLFDEPRKNRPIFENFSEEKALRLLKHPRHHSSHESRNDKKKFYGGAIRTKNGFIISCSGMSEHQDEALCLCLAVHLYWLKKEEAAKIAEKSGNKTFKRLLKTIK
jgi:hypothetical protein